MLYVQYGSEEDGFKKIQNHLVVHFTGASKGYDPILACGYVCGFANLSPKFDGVLGTGAGQDYPCIWFNRNTKDGKL